MPATAVDPFAARWRGQPGRLEVWYATATDTATGLGLWLHHEVVAPTEGAPYAHGWIAVFPPGGQPRAVRFGPQPPGADRPADRWFDAAGAAVARDRFTGQADGASWDLACTEGQRTLWTFPATAWQRELLPAAQVVPAPRIRLRGELRIDGDPIGFDGVGNLAHIYGHGNAERWGWLHADLDDTTTVEIVAAVSRRPGLSRLPPLAFVQLRRAGHRDWPANSLAAAPLFRTRLADSSWSVRGTVGRQRLSVTVQQPRERCVALEYVDPDGAVATCVNTELADVHVRLQRLSTGWRTVGEWRLDGRAHAELGSRER